ncbi:MAG: arsenate reductase ArsC [Phycisphaerae bacterium]
MAEKLKVLFLCTGNSCRSQMAEGWARHLKGDIIEAFSAGVNPVNVSQRAIKVMAQAGVDISNHRSKHVEELTGLDFDYVVTVCDSAKEHCPFFANARKMIHKSFSDPANTSGTDEQVMAEFRRVRDEIKAFVQSMPQILEKE